MALPRLKLSNLGVGFFIVHRFSQILLHILFYLLKIEVCFAEFLGQLPPRCPYGEPPMEARVSQSMIRKGGGVRVRNWPECLSARTTDSYHD